MIRTEAEAMALLRRKRVVAVVPEFVSEVAGEPVRGSWWAHPMGKEIYRLLSALEDRDDVLFTRLCDGKVTLVHRSLWPTLLRAAMDPQWRERAAKKLSAADRKLLAQVDREGEVVAKKSALEKVLLVHTRQEHTPRGSHQTVLESWAHWVERTGTKPDERLSFEDAVEALARACPGAHLPF